MRSNVDTTFAFDARGSLSLTIGSGDIIVTSWSRDQIRIHATSDDEDIRFDANESRVQIDLTERSHGDARFEVTVPAGVRVIARSRSGDISVTGTRGEVEVHTQNGDVRVQDATDRVEIATLSGDVEASNLSGDIQINSVNGDLRITGLKGDIEATSTSGSVVLRNAAARYVRAKTTSGDVEYDGSITANGRYELGTHSGDLRLAVPANSAATVSIATWSGSIESPDFPITLKPGDHGMGPSTKRYTFDIGSGGARVNVDTFSGDITIASKPK